MIEILEGGVRHGGTARVAHWWTSRWGWRLAAEVGVLASLFVLYRWVRYLVRDQVPTAFDNLELIRSIEGAMGLLVEQPVNAWSVRSELFVGVVNRYYVYGHFHLMLLVMAGLYLFRHDVYRPFRNLLVGSTALGMVIHWLFPLAPPRLRPDLGFVDTVAEFGPSVYASGSLTADEANRIAAMPSLHAGWALVVALGLMAVCQGRCRRWALLHPAIMTFVIVATANHWWLDAVGGFAVVAIAALHPAARPWTVRRSGAGERGDDRGDRIPVRSVGGDVRHPELVAQSL
ncbi:MAG: phosphatase PAP2 family protein [Actinomycetota bacterium]